MSSNISDFNETDFQKENDIPSMYNITIEDASWIMTSAFIIFTMQTGNK